VRDEFIDIGISKDKEMKRKTSKMRDFQMGIFQSTYTTQRNSPSNKKIFTTEFL
jgi:hypothetical protein